MKIMPSNKKIVMFTLSFLIPILLFATVLFFQQIMPFGDRTILSGDLNNQYISYLAYLKQNIFNIDNLKYSFSMTMGGNFFGILGYYLLSPLNLIILLFPLRSITLAITIIIILKIGFLGLTMFTFLNYQSGDFVSNLDNIGKTRINCVNVLLSSSYALMSYQLAYLDNIMWTDSIILLPLVILGIEEIIKCKKPYIYIWSLFFSILFNYYIGFMICIFSLIYYCLRVFIKNNFSSINLKSIAKNALRFGTSSVIAGCMASLTILPGLKAVSNLKNAKYQFSFGQVNSPMDLGTQLFSGIGAKLSNVPYFFSGILVLVLVILYFTNVKIDIKERLSYFLFLVILFISQNTSGTYLIWHGFNQPMGMPNRNAFVFSFILIIIAQRGYYLFENRFLNNAFKIEFGYLIFAIIMSKFYPNVITNKILIFNIFVFSTILFSIYLINKDKKVVFIVLAIFSFGDLLVNSYESSFYNDGLSASSFSKFYKNTSEIINRVKNNDKSFYRIGTTFARSNDDPLLFNYRGLSNYSSAENPDTIKFVQGLGYFQNHDWWRWTNYNNGSTFATDSLLGIKYVISNSNKEIVSNSAGSQLGGNNEEFSMPNYDLNYSDKYHNNVYKNTYALGLVNVTNNKNILKNLHDGSDTSTNLFKRLNTVFRRIFDIENLYSKNKVTESSYNSTNTRRSFNTVINKKGAVYFYLPTSNAVNIGINELESAKIMLSINGNKGGNIYSQQQNGIAYLGNYNKGDKIHLSISGDSKTVNFKQLGASKPLIYTENTNLVSSKLMDLKKSAPKNIKISSTKIEFDTNYSGSRTAFLTIPYDQGWKARSNGNSITTEKALGGLLAFNIKGGHQHIVLDYSVPGVRLGIIVFLSGTLALVAYILILNKIRDRKNSRNNIN